MLRVEVVAAPFEEQVEEFCMSPQEIKAALILRILH
jgi:hypothetical protein